MGEVPGMASRLLQGGGYWGESSDCGRVALRVNISQGLAGCFHLGFEELLVGHEVEKFSVVEFQEHARDFTWV